MPGSVDETGSVEFVMALLLDCNLVSVSTSGTRRIYAINRPGFDRLNLWLDQFWS